MKMIQRKFLWLCLVLGCGRLMAAVPADAPVINGIAVAGTNLDFTATFPVGVARAVLEMRPTLLAEWQSAAVLNVPADGGTVEFTIPKPEQDMAFFRLNAALRATTNIQLSAELQYVAVPPLGPEGTNTDDVVFHFKGLVDGSDRIVITRAGALWEHVNWGWPAGAVNVNGSQWNPSEKNFLTTTGAVAFLPEEFSLAAVRLERIEGRDVVALERTNAALMVYLDDTPPGGAPYEFKIHFQRTVVKPEAARASPMATLKIAAVIDGSDVLKITRHDATWTHLAWGRPATVQLNDLLWDLHQTNVLTNVGTNSFLPAKVDFSTAKIVRRQGRDLVTLWADADELQISFADNPNGADGYELEISFGP